MKKILFIPGSYLLNFCGIGDYCFHLISELQKEMQIFLYLENNSKKTNGEHYYYQLKKTIHLIKLLQIYKKNKFNLIHLQYPTKIFSDPIFVFSIFLFFLLIPKVKIISTIHEIKPYYKLQGKKIVWKSKGYWLKLKILLKISAHVIATNRDEAQFIRKNFRNCSVIPIFSNLAENYSPSRFPVNKYSYLLKYKTLFFFGNLHWNKEIMPFFYALKYLNEEYIFIIAYGNDDTNEKEKYLKYLKKENLSHRVHWLYRISGFEIEYLIKIAHVTFLPYKNGISARSGVYLAFLQFQKKIIAKMHHDSPRWIIKSINGIYHDSTNPKELAEIIEKIALQENQINYFNFFLKEYFSLHSVSKKHISLYKKLLSPKILTVRKFKLGDSLLWTPFLLELRKIFPDSTIDIITGFSNMIPFWKRIPCINRIYYEGGMENSWNFIKKLQLLRTIRKNQYDLLFLSSMETGMALKSFFWKIPRRYGFKDTIYYQASKDYFSFLLTKQVSGFPAMQESLRNLKLLEVLGKTSIQGRPYYPTICFSKFNSKIQEYKNKIILFNPIGNSPGRSLPFHVCKKLFSLINIPNDMMFVLTGKKEDYAFNERIFQSIHCENKMNLSGKTNIDDLAAIIENSMLVITVDSGISHLASVYNKKMIILWGPGDKTIFSPIYSKSDEVYIFEGSSNCGPCQYLCSKPLCYQNLNFNEIAEKIQSILEN